MGIKSKLTDKAKGASVKGKLTAIAIGVGIVVVACGGPESVEGRVTDVRYLPQVSHIEREPNTASKCTTHRVPETRTRVVNKKTTTYTEYVNRTECKKVHTGGFHNETEIDRQARYCIELDGTWYTVSAPEYFRVKDSNEKVELRYLHEGC